MDTIRNILLWMEEQPRDRQILRAFPGFPDQQTTWGHVRLLEDGGYLWRPQDGFIAISWEGHELLDKIRDDGIWSQTKAGATKVGAWSVSLLADLAAGYIKQKAIELGLPI